jgi:hypothetical protein
MVHTMLAVTIPNVYQILYDKLPRGYDKIEISNKLAVIGKNLKDEIISKETLLNRVHSEILLDAELDDAISHENPEKILKLKEQYCTIGIDISPIINKYNLIAEWDGQGCHTLDKIDE